MLQTRKTTNASLVRAYQSCERVLCRPLLRDIEENALGWVQQSTNYSEIKSLLLDGIYLLSEQEPRKSLTLCMNLLPEAVQNPVKHALFDTAFDLQKDMDTPDGKITILEQMMVYLDGDEDLSGRYRTTFWESWVDAVKRVSNARLRIDAVNRAVGMDKDDEGNITLSRDDTNLRKSASIILMDAMTTLDENDAVPTILDMSKIALPETPAYRDMVEHAVMKLNTLEDGEDRVHYASIILDATDNDSIRSKAAVSILENIDALPHSSQKLSLLIKSSLTFEPHSELERKSALKWAEIAIQTRLRTSVTMEEIMTEAMQAPDTSFLKEQALQLAISLSAVLMKQQWMSEREKGIRLALAALPYTKEMDRLREKAIEILLTNVDVITKAHDQAHYAYDVLQYAQQGSEQAHKGIQILVETTEGLTNTTRPTAESPSENDLCLAYMYRAATLVADNAENEQVVIQKWTTALKSLPNRKEKLGHLIRCLKETPRERLLYTVAWENYDRLIKEKKQETDKAKEKSSSDETGDDTEKKPYLKVVGE